MSGTTPVTYTVGYAYDALDRTTVITYPDGEVITQTYDNRGLPLALIGDSDYVTQTTYNAAGQMKKRVFGNGLETRYGYFGYQAYGQGSDLDLNMSFGSSDPKFYGRLLQTCTVTQGGSCTLQGSGPVLNLSDWYDVGGNVTALRDASNANQVQHFAYDTLDRLVYAYTEEQGGTSAGTYTRTYAYDAVGNMSGRRIDDGNWVTYTYALTQPHAVTGLADGSFSAVYDANGNMITRTEAITSAGAVATYTQEFDVENRLVRVVSGTQETLFLYTSATLSAGDGDGARVAQVTPDGVTTLYVGELYEVRRGSPDAVTRYYYLGGQRVAMRQPDDAVVWLHGDHLGSTSLTTGGSGNVGARQAYYPFGATRWVTGTLPTDFGFTGQRNDGYIKLVQMGVRWYDPQVGRWISPDTIIPDPANPQSLNRYAYVYNNPMRHVDPSGYGIKEDLEKFIKDAGRWVRNNAGDAYRLTVTKADVVYDAWVDNMSEPGSYNNTKSTWQAMGIAFDWFFETDEARQRFGPEEPITQDVRHDPAIAEFKEKWAAEEYRLPFSASHTTDDREGPLVRRLIGGAEVYAIENGQLLLSINRLGSSSAEGEIDAVGGTIGSFDKISVFDAGNGWVKFEMYNETHWGSGTRIPGTNKWIINPRLREKWGPGGDSDQTFFWWEYMYQDGGSGYFEGP